VGPVLGAGFPAGAPIIPIQDEASIVLVRAEVRRLGVAQGLPAERFEGLISAASELGHNQLAHGFRGSMAVAAIARGGVPGVEVVAVDSGRGIGDPTAALAGQPRAVGSLGVGLSAAYRLSDEMDFDVRVGEGTYLAARKFAAPLPRNEVAIFGRPIAGESESGDDAGFVRTEDSTLVGVADGLGHGPEARAAAAPALAALRAHGAGDLPALLATCHQALQGTRGAVMAAARFDRRAGIITHAAAGNITTQLCRPGHVERFVASSRVLGARGVPAGRFVVEHAPLSPRTLLVMFSDGIPARADLSEDAELLRQPPVVIAHQLVLRYGRATDDAIVLVACCP
jgi:anti-sigma regulatory factor (Ser/Thr protein kinase)